MKVITAIYLHCRPDLRDEWLTGIDVDADVEDSLVGRLNRIRKSAANDFLCSPKNRLFVRWFDSSTRSTTVPTLRCFIDVLRAELVQLAISIPPLLSHLAVDQALHPTTSSLPLDP